MENINVEEYTSLLSKNEKIEGEVRGNESLRIEGTINGLIEIKGNLLVGQSGKVEADVEASNVVIQGKVTGNVMARERLEIHNSGQLIGDISARSIDIREGASFEGRSRMMKTATSAASKEDSNKPA